MTAAKAEKMGCVLVVVLVGSQQQAGLVGGPLGGCALGRLGLRLHSGCFVTDIDSPPLVRITPTYTQEVVLPRLPTVISDS